MGHDYTEEMEMDHLSNCTSLLTGDEQTEYHNGPGRCVACEVEWTATQRSEMAAEGVCLATLDAENAADRNQAIEDAVLDGLYRTEAAR
jgi:hypothetical protein